MTAPFSLSPAMMLSLFPQNRVQGDTASLLLSAHQQDCAQEQEASASGKALRAQPLLPVPQPGQSPQGMVVRSQPLGNPKVSPSTKGY